MDAKRLALLTLPPAEAARMLRGHLPGVPADAAVVGAEVGGGALVLLLHSTTFAEVGECRPVPDFPLTPKGG